MEELKLVRDWILAFPRWGEQPLAIDSTEATPESCGLFPVGVEELDRREDVLGNVHCKYRQQFLLRRVANRGEDAAGWLMEFSKWARAQAAPALGEQATVRAEKGRLLSAATTGIATYEVKIIIEYTEVK